MNDDEFADRRELIAERASEASPPYTFWLTRNRHEGELSSKIDVWLARPQRMTFADGDVHWYVHGEGAEREHYARWTLDRARRDVHSGIPDTDRECVRVESAGRPLLSASGRGLGL